MRKVLLTGAALLGLSACQPAIPDSAAGVTGPVPDKGRGVGFENSVTDFRERQAALASPSVPPTVIGSPPPPVAGAAGPVSQPVQTTPTAADAELQRLNREAAARARAANSGQEVVNASPSNVAPAIVNNPGISSEQDFGSVSARRSIEGDAARIQSNRQQYQVIAPTALPSREGGSQPNIVSYALETNHPKGTQVWRRSGLASQAKTRRNCASYGSDDEAQIAFLTKGGPERDRDALDPDGDGFACGWDPAPFRRVQG